MNGERWVFAEMEERVGGRFPGDRASHYAERETVAEVSTRVLNRRQANAFHAALARRLGKPLGSYITRAKSNPTLYHHRREVIGAGGGASYHVVTRGLANNILAVADLYTPSRTQAIGIAQAIADVTGLRLELLTNGENKKRIADHPRVPLKRGNPASELAVGQVWRTFPAGVKLKVLEVKGWQVRVHDAAKGDRYWMDGHDLKSTAKLLPATKPNPARRRAAKPRARKRLVRRARARNPHVPGRRPLREQYRSAVASLLRAAGFAELAKEVRAGADPIRALDTALPLAGHAKPQLTRARQLIASLRRSGGEPNPRRARPRAKRAKKAARKNPEPRELAKARDVFRMWHEFDSSTMKRVQVPNAKMPRYVVKLGDVVRIDYKSNKWEGKTVTYTHATKRPYPLLVTDPDAKQLYLVGGKMKPTADGLVN